MKRILDCQSSDFLTMSRQELLDAIAGGEGRTIACETIGSIIPMLGDITNAEFAAAMGADILLLNMFDVQNPYIQGLPKTDPGNVIRKLKELTGRPIGINLEPVEQVLSSEDPAENMWAMTNGRKATLENAKKAGVGDLITASVKDIADFNIAEDRAIVITNPPYGERLLEIKEAEELYKTMGKVMPMERGKKYFVICPNDDFESRFGRPADKRRKLYNGMIKCQLYSYFKTNFAEKE